jgi:5'(3')-deoxyribonucleotidase
MRLNEVTTQQTKYIIACDMDGVLADFDTGMSKLLGIPDRKALSNTQFHKRLDELIVKGVPTYGILPFMPDGAELWNYIKQYDPFILTSTGHRHPAEVEKEKREWVRSHISPNVKVITVQHSHLKAEYATPTTILIDDREKSINPWIEKGGIGILHKNTADTIAQLKKLGL